MQRDQMTEEQYLRAQLAEMARRYEEAIKPYVTRLAALAHEGVGNQFERVERAPTIDAPTVRAARCPEEAPAVKESRGARHIPKEGDDFCSGAQAKAPGEGSLVVVGLDAARKGVTDAFFVSLFKTLVEDKGKK